MDDWSYELRPPKCPKCFDDLYKVAPYTYKCIRCVLEICSYKVVKEAT
jgi:hypothetical protein